MVTSRLLLCLSFLSAAAGAQNLPPNGDFDSGTTGWTGGTLYDAEGSPSAPSYQVSSPDNSQNHAQSDCFTVEGSKYYLFSGNIKVVSGAIGIIQVVFYQDLACTVEFEYEAASSTVKNWFTASAFYSIPFYVPNTVASGRVILTANLGSVLFDHISLEAIIFADGFDPTGG